MRSEARLAGLLAIALFITGCSRVEQRSGRLGQAELKHVQLEPGRNAEESFRIYNGTEFHLLWVDCIAARGEARRRLRLYSKEKLDGTNVAFPPYRSSEADDGELFDWLVAQGKTDDPNQKAPRWDLIFVEAAGYRD